MIHKGAETQQLEKWLLRKSFDTPESPFLPHNVLWRQKEQFSDGVGYSWIDRIKAHAEEVVTDQKLKMAPNRFPVKTPRTKEAYMFRQYFASHYGENGAACETVGW